MSNSPVKRNNNVSNVKPPPPPPPSHYNPNHVGPYQNPPNGALRQVNNLPQDIEYVDVTYRNKIRNMHIAYVSAVIVSAVIGFQAATFFVKPKVMAPAAQMVQAALSNNLQVTTGPRINSFDQKILRNEIYEKYDKARELIRTKHFEESAAKNRTQENFYSSEEYFQMKRQYETAKLELSGQEAIELCDKVQYACREANDYKNSKRRVANVEK